MNCVDRFYVLGNQDAKLQFSGNFNVGVGKAIRLQSTDTMNIASGAAMRLAAKNPISIGSGDKVIIAGTQIGLNTWVPTTPDPADPPKPLEKYSLPNRSSSAQWSGGIFYKTSDIVSIMQRVPTHEPWDHHESVNPSNFTPERTDSRTTPPLDTGGNPTAPSDICLLYTSPSPRITILFLNLFQETRPQTKHMLKEYLLRPVSQVLLNLRLGWHNVKQKQLGFTPEN